MSLPEPHHADQTQAFPPPIDTAFGPLVMNLRIDLRRKPRQKCSACGLRRVGFSIGLGEVEESPPLCAKCAGIR